MPTAEIYGPAVGMFTTYVQQNQRDNVSLCRIENQIDAHHSLVSKTYVHCYGLTHTPKHIHVHTHTHTHVYRRCRVKQQSDVACWYLKMNCPIWFPPILCLHWHSWFWVCTYLYLYKRLSRLIFAFWCGREGRLLKLKMKTKWCTNAPSKLNSYFHLFSCFSEKLSIQWQMYRAEML